MDLKKFASELTYPEISVERNLADSRLLMPSYGGNASEITAIMTYSFQHFVCPVKEIGEILAGISTVEMRHMELLGEAIVELGGYPIIGGRTYWNGSYVNYTLDTKKFLRQNILAEENAILNYERTILNLSQDSLKQLLERIILDEELHIKLFKELLQTI
ncbi:MAG: manganese catalase family protein [Clostridia bacterium]|nr:manganese catalase family protein [Clostridia bacterium]